MSNNDWEKIEIGLSPAVNWDETKSVSGKLTDVREAGPNNSKLYTLEQADGSSLAVWGNGVIDDKMAKVELSTEVKIDFEGWIDSKNGRKYRNFSVFTKKVD